ncbi:MAG: ribose-phosphate pyrophosphokinase [Alphaproteobacteria bacterium]|nr:ribose-phosphate pyrophosphokinase [Alphaproteobacteria bacterium]
MTPLLIPMPGNSTLATELRSAFSCEIVSPELHRFPDEEVRVTLPAEFAGRDVHVLCSLDRPDDKILPIVFIAALARELGARRIGLIAPYLAYMRQDKRFNPGEAISSRPFARLLSQSFDWLLTVDPHLHRYKSLCEIYSIRTRVVHAAPALAQWIRTNVPRPVLVGPDGESAQWVSEVARDCSATYTVMRKVRHDDRTVDVEFADATSLAGRTPVLVDDIISSGQTMLSAIKALGRHGTATPICLAVHGVFASTAYDELLRSGARVLSTNTIFHPSNAVSLASPIASALEELHSSL